MSGYLIHVLTIFVIEAMVVLSYAIAVGSLGYVNFGQVALLAVGAYASAALTLRGISFWVAVPLAVMITGAVALLLALPTRRIRGDYYALMTLGFLFVVQAVILNWTDVTQGTLGLIGIGRPAGFGAPADYLILSAIILLAVGAFVYRLVSSPYGAALGAIRDDEEVAKTLGKPSFFLKVSALTLSGILVGCAGALLAHFLQFINAQVFWLDRAVWFLAALVIGGLGSFRGALIGIFILTASFEVIRFLPLDPTVIGPVRNIFYSLILIVVLLVRPKGVCGRVQLEQ
jgi:ABC-type branched-subunit amino acid transport system permease subunit